MSNSENRLDVFRNLLIGSSFPAFALSLLACWVIFLIAMLLAPSGPSGLGAFAEDFRIWCFGYDPETGRTELAYVMAMIVPQFVIGAFIAYCWWEPLRELAQKPRIAARYLGIAMLLVGGARPRDSRCPRARLRPENFHFPPKICAPPTRHRNSR